MGSDDGSKKSYALPVSFLWQWKPTCRRRRQVLLLVCCACCCCLAAVLVSPEWVFTHTFTPETAQLPPQCVEKAHAFYQHQLASSRQRRLVLACHRRGCRASLLGGHCEPCGGIGDRTRFLLSQVENAVQAGRRVQLDAPMADLAILDSAVYRDPAGWWAELGRFRSYNVNNRRVIQKEQLLSDRAPTLFTHFTPSGLHVHEYDPCTFHMLLQPTPSLRADIERHNQAMRNLVAGPSIGIHFRTGDAAAFGIANNDTRVGATDLLLQWHKMLACADSLQQELFPPMEGPVTYFLATDNAEVKQWARQESSLSALTTWQNEQDGPRRVIYTTDFEPESYLRGNGADRNAWMEVYLLAARDALVVNVRPNDYHGTAGRISYFASLAKKLGFLDDHHVKECVLDTSDG